WHWGRAEAARQHPLVRGAVRGRTMSSDIDPVCLISEGVGANTGREGSSRAGAGGSRVRVEGQQGRSAIVAVRDRVVAAVVGGVQGDDVGAVGEGGAAGHGEPPVVVVGDGPR